MSKGPEAQGTLSPRGRKPKRLEAQGARMKLYWYIRLLYSKMSERKKENRNRNIKLPKFLDSRRLNNTTSLISICWFLKCISYNLFDINNLFHGHCPILRCRLKKESGAYIHFCPRVWWENSNGFLKKLWLCLLILNWKIDLRMSSLASVIKNPVNQLFSSKLQCRK